MGQCAERRAERLKRQENEDFDEEEAEAIKEENELEEELFQQVANAVGSMLKNYKDPIMPLVENILVRFYPMLDKVELKSNWLHGSTPATDILLLARLSGKVNCRRAAHRDWHHGGYVRACSLAVCQVCVTDAADIPRCHGGA